jgi:hypothetical protein
VPANHNEHEMKFLISLHINPAGLDALNDGEEAAIGEGHGKFVAEMNWRATVGAPE